MNPHEKKCVFKNVRTHVDMAWVAKVSFLRLTLHHGNVIGKPIKMRVGGGGGQALLHGQARSPA